MPMTYVVDHERREVYTTAEGPVTLDDVRKHLAGEHGDEALAYCELIDATRATAAFSSSDVRAIVEILRARGREGRLGPTAIVVGNDLTYGVLRMLAILLDDVCALEPFRTRQEAMQFLASASV